MPITSLMRSLIRVGKPIDHKFGKLEISICVCSLRQQKVETFVNNVLARQERYHFPDQIHVMTTSSKHIPQYYMAIQDTFWHHHRPTDRLTS